MDLEILKQANKISLEIQNTDIQSFILKNQKNYDKDFLRLIADQWQARQKAKHKLSSWYAHENIILPPPLSVEQASSEITANYKAEVFSKVFGNEHCIDLTGGMGLDSWALSKYTKSVTYVEQREDLAQIAAYNFKVLEQKNIEVINENSEDFIKTNRQAFINFYIDPHRRDSEKNKVFKIEDCEPNLLIIKDILQNYMVKFSPMLDIKLALEQLQTIREVHVVSVENEVKELLFLSKNEVSKTKIICTNFLSDKSTQKFEFDYISEENTHISYLLPSNYIYEPNASIMKAGAFKSIAQQLKIEKLAPNSHLYTSESLVVDFPGRSFHCEAVCKFDKKEILSKLPTNKANISTRNFPMKPEEIKKKLGLHDGGEYYLFATESLEKQKIVLICRKVS
jgi:16S rRNA G966 N2-methylase RsmD